MRTSAVLERTHDAATFAERGELLFEIAGRIDKSGNGALSRSEIESWHTELLWALSDWIVAGGPGCAYPMPDAVGLLEDFAEKNGVSGSFVGPKNAPTINL